VSDGWSLDVLIRELSSLYNAFCAGKPSPLAELPLQYADFALWQRQWLEAAEGHVLPIQLDYWRGMLNDIPPLLELPLDRPRKPVQTFPGAQHLVTFPAALAEALHQLS